MVSAQKFQLAEFRNRVESCAPGLEYTMDLIHDLHRIILLFYYI